MTPLRQLRISKEHIFVVCIAFVFSCLNIIDVIVYKFRQPPHTLYIGISHWYQDYFYYLSQLTQGERGDWLTHNAFTTEYTTPSLIWWYNILLGKITALLHLYPWTVFNGSVFLLSFLYIVISYWLLSKIFPQSRTSRICALIISLTSTNLFTLTFHNGFSIQPITYFYAYTSAFNRIGGVSHLIAQNILSVLLIWQYARHITSSELHHNPYLSASLVAVLSVSLFIISPVFVFTDLLSCGLLFLWSFRFLRHSQKILSALLPIIASGILLLPLYLWYQNAFTDPFFEYMRVWETSMAQTPLTTFVVSAGCIVVLVLCGIPFYLRNATPFRRIGIIYAFLPIFLYYSPIPQLLKLPSFRFFQPPAYIFFAAIAVEALRSIRLASDTVLTRSKQLILLTVLFVSIQSPALYHEISDKLGHYYLNSTINYLDVDLYNGLAALTLKPRTPNVLATNNLELLVPVISGLTVYSGHLTLTFHYGQKVTEVYNFYNGTMNQQDAQKFLTGARIGYVLWNKQNGETKLLAYYPFLKILYENPTLIVFVPQ